MTIGKKSLEPNSFITDPNSDIVKIHHKYMYSYRKDVKALVGELQGPPHADGAKALSGGLEHCKHLRIIH